MTLRQARLYYNLVAANQRLQDKRHPMFEKNRVMRILGYVFVGFWALYLMMFGYFFYELFDGGAMEAFDMIDGGMVIFLLADFLLRFGLQDTPAHNIKPYKLLPIPTNFLLNVFLLRLGLQLYNLFWGFFFVPFALFAVVKFYGFMGMISYLFGWWLVFVFNGYIYLISRYFVNKHVASAVVPVAVYVALIYFGIIFDDRHKWLFDACVWLGRQFTGMSDVAYLSILAACVPVYIINYRLQHKAIYQEISRTEAVEMVRTREMHFFDRFGEIGEYLKLEVRSMRRNGVIRKQFMTGFYCMIVFNGLYAFTNLYDGSSFWQTYICIYCFACLCTMTLTCIMCAEGNYIDGLMSRKESVLSLLKAKYYFNCVWLLIPMLFCLMPVSQGKIGWLDMFGCMFFTSGVVMPFLFQLAVYNDSTIRLSEKTTRSGQSTKTQMIFSSAALFVPMILKTVLMEILPGSTSSLIMLVIGLVGTLAHPLWLRNIYRRFMARRYEIMDGFRNSK